MSDALVDFFSRLPLFEPLTRDELLELLRGIRPVEVPAGQYLMRQGDPADAMYVVDTGTVAVELTLADGLPAEVDRCGRGAVIGDMGLIDGRPRSASVRAVESARLLRIDRGEFEFLLRNNRPAAYKVMRSICRTVCERLRRTEEEIDGLLRPDLTPVPTPVEVTRSGGGRFARLLSGLLGRNG
jgi:CRP-like cAMP-binding protein